MIKYLKSTSYFIKESFIIFKSNFVSNLLSIVSLSLVFFLFTILLTGRYIASDIALELSNQAQISIYYDESISEIDVSELKFQIEAISGVENLKSVSSEEAKESMVSVLGKDAEILNYFEESPFSPFLEVEIDLDKFDDVLSELGKLNNITYIRDNYEILKNLKSFINILTFAFAFVSIAMAAITIILTSHIVRQGIYNNREQIKTLKLLGSPNAFMIIPHIIVGLFITMSSALIAIIFEYQIITFAFANYKSPLPFISLPSGTFVFNYSVLFLMITGFTLGICGSFLGWLSVKESN